MKKKRISIEQITAVLPQVTGEMAVGEVCRCPYGSSGDSGSSGEPARRGGGWTARAGAHAVRERGGR